MSKDLDRQFTPTEVVEMMSTITRISNGSVVLGHDDMNRIAGIKFDTLQSGRALTPEEEADTQRIGKLYLATLTQITLELNSQVQRLHER